MSFSNDHRDHLVLIPLPFHYMFIPILFGQLQSQTIKRKCDLRNEKCCTAPDLNVNAMRWFQNGGIIMPTKAKPTEAYPNQKHNKPTWKNAKKTDRASGNRQQGSGTRARTWIRTRIRAGPRTETGKIQRENPSTTQLNQDYATHFSGIHQEQHQACTQRNSALKLK